MRAGFDSLYIVVSFYLILSGASSVKNGEAMDSQVVAVGRSGWCMRSFAPINIPLEIPGFDDETWLSVYSRT